MCVTKELKHMVCQHTDRYTKECLTKRGALLRCLSKCNPRTQSSSVYDLCYECRRCWAEHQVSEQEATRSYVIYREAHNYDGPLSPTFIFSANDVIQVGYIGAAGESSQVMQTSAGPSGVDMRSPQNLTPMLYGRLKPDKRSSDTSIRTQWFNQWDLESDWVQQSQSQAGNEKRKGKDLVRHQSKPAQSGPKGVLLLSEDEEGPPKWI
jgi:hypothetical protein